ncbi:efflux RND transporter periplasmic adaptor subunit [Eilatimonas milleporae]|uniref:RND family efflux transporter MFP subunit n=1 Tax=Eilatimonas milleporae TaxID=911205 RepID=A0A3M0BTL4_9PROT|nr:efflux RND transporter periplasmic adaptor subunit [Eilatimonas milleporae]RMB00668.1 RND family efflux transporter MFP subunit [Eilatimonas milleporae]
MPRPFVFTICVLAICSALFTPPSQAQAPINVSHPVVREIVDWDEYTGRFEAVERVEVRARVDGYLYEAPFQEGALVEAGTILFVIDQRPFKIALDAAQAELAEAESQLRLARREAERGGELRRNGNISQEAFDQRREQAIASEATLRAAEALVARAELDMEFTTVRASISGRVGSKLVTKGNLISGNVGGTVLTTIVSQDPIYFTFEASESDYLKYARQHFSGARASSRDAPNPVKVRLLDEKDFVHEGVMNYVENELNASSGTLRGRAVISNTDGFLQPGQFGRLRLLGSGEYRAILLPDSVVQSEQSRKFVFTVDENGTVARRIVQPGALYDGLRVIREGLNGEELIVINGFHRVRPGMTVDTSPVSIDTVLSR